MTTANPVVEVRLCDEPLCTNVAKARVRVLDGKVERIACHVCAEHLESIRTTHAARSSEWPALTLDVVELLS